jgi:hypothetical protein
MAGRSMMTVTAQDASLYGATSKKKPASSPELDAAKGGRLVADRPG